MNSTNFFELPRPVTGHMAVSDTMPDQVNIFCYEDEVPPFVARELERLYGSFFSTMTHFNASGRLEKISTYVAAKGGEISALFLFSMMRKKISVLNEVITVKPHDLLQFSNYIFSTYDAIQLISFHAIQIDRVQLKRPVQRINCLEDIVLRLPDSNDEYFMRLGKSTRKTIKGYTNKLKRDFPSFNNQVYHNEAADELDIRTIIELSRARLLMNGKVSTFDEAAIVRILHSVKVYGLVCVAKINGEICAGSISYRVGKNYFMHVSAHDLFYDDYRLGMLYRYLTISECIKQNGSECHFLWGRQEYKFSFLGVQRDLHELVIYRSRLRYLLEGATVVQIAYKDIKRRTLLMMRDWKERKGSIPAYIARMSSKRSLNNREGQR